MPIKKVDYVFNPFEAVGKTPPKNLEKRDAILADVAEAVQDYILERVSRVSSPVSGGAWKKTLNKDYRQQKIKEGASPIANMELSGEMLNALKAVPVGNRIRVGIEGSQAGKADGHNNFSNKSKLPLREFIPKKGQKFKRDLLSDIRGIIADHEDEE